MVGRIPLYKAGIPPSVLYMVTSVLHIPGKFLLCKSVNWAKDADCTDNLVLTISRGYVKVTEVMPANPPQMSRLKGVRSAPGDGSMNFIEGQPLDI